MVWREIRADSDVAFPQEHYLDAEAMREVIVQRMQADHEFEVKKKAQEKANLCQRQREQREGLEGDDDNDNEEVFDLPAAIEAAAKAVRDGGRYMYGISYAPSTTLQTFMHFHVVDFNDACHLHSKTNGMMFVTNTLDTDHHIVPIMYSIFLDNERQATWDLHNDAIDEAYTKAAFDTVKRRRIIDGDKGEIASMTSHLTLGNWFACSMHLAKRVSTNVGQGGKIARMLYQAALNVWMISPG